MKNLDGPSGGPATISGILYQMLRSLAFGCGVTARGVRNDGRAGGATLFIEPAGGGDLRLEGARPIVEQIKMRRGRRPWSAGEIAALVLPDLMRAVRPAADQEQLFRFTTDRREGLDELRLFTQALKSMSAAHPRALDDVQKDFRYGRLPCTARGMYLRLARRADASSDDAHDRLWTVLRHLELVAIPEHLLIQEIDALLGVLADDQDAVPALRAKLIHDLMIAARGDGMVSMTSLLEQNYLDPERLLHTARLPRHLEGQARKDAGFLLYHAAEDVRPSALHLPPVVSVLCGESGQGKTWAMCRAALSEAEAGRPVVILTARGSVAALEAEIVKRVWLSAYDAAIPLVTAARRLQPQLRDADGFWLTVYLDDLHDRDLARALIGAQWPELGIRLVITAQPMIQAMFENAGDSATFAIPDFSMPELRAFLSAAGRNPAKIPDDVLALLQRPILARTFVRLPEAADWSDPSEYRLMEQYWAFAARHYRDQPRHLSDVEGLKALAGTLLGANPTYPFATRLRMASLDDEATGRLVQVGLVQEGAAGLAFTHDRLLNWAVASFLADQAVDGALAAEALAADIERARALRTMDGDPLGNRLGYVRLDLVWLLARANRTDLLAEFLLLKAREAAKHDGDERFLSQHLATVGPPIVPALRRMIEDPLAGTNEWLWRGYIASALRRIGRDAPDVVRKTIAPLLDAESGALQLAALETFRSVPAPQAADRMFSLHLRHARALDDDEAGEFHDRYVNHQASFGALATAIRARPDWLVARLDEAEDPEALDRLLWLLLELDRVVALPIWQRFKPKVFAAVDRNAAVLSRAISAFVDRDEQHRLESPVGDDPGRTLTALQFDALTRLDAARAAQRLQTIALEDLWGTSGWWMDRLMHRAGDAAHSALRPASRPESDPYQMLMWLYAPRIELLDPATLDDILDSFEQRLAEPVEDGTDPLEPVWRWLEFLRAVTTPALIDCIHRRRGSALEARLASRAGARAGRTSRVVDMFGDAAREVLALMAGDGFDALALAELSRSDGQGREDGLLTALWTDSAQVGDALKAFPRDAGDDQYRAVLLHHALAAHRRDRTLAELLAVGALTYNNAVEIRRSRPPMSDAELAPYRTALRRGSLEEACQAVRMSAFAGRADLFADVVDALLRDGMGPALMAEAIGIFRYNSLYDPRLLSLVRACFEPGDKGAFAAGYLAAHGDAEARAAASDWLSGLPAGPLHQRELVVAEALLEHPDSEPPALAFLHRRLEGRHRGHYAGLTMRLAKAGDAEAIRTLHARAFRSPDMGEDHPINAIRFLGDTAPGEAFAAAERLFARHHEAAAARELLLLDGKSALPILLDAYTGAGWELRWWLGRLLRWHGPRAVYLARLDAMAASERQQTRREAAELAGWLPGSQPVPLLGRLAEDPVRDVEKAAFEALRRRRMETIGIALMAQLDNAPRPLAWMRMKAVLRLVDPHLLRRRDDEAWLDPVLDRLPAEFRIEAESQLRAARKKVEDEAKKRDRERADAGDIA